MRISHAEEVTVVDPQNRTIVAATGGYSEVGNLAVNIVSSQCGCGHDETSKDDSGHLDPPCYASFAACQAA